MEGVAVIAERDGSTVLTAVMSDSAGRYTFPQDRLGPGHYAITIRAAGYELVQAQTITVAATPAKLDLQLLPVTDPSRLASQLTNLEWFNSFPGSTQQKDMLVRSFVNCGFCHTVERIARSTHTPQEFLSVIQRMSSYDFDHTSFGRPQVVDNPRPLEGLDYNGYDARALANYLATLNLSDGRGHWGYALQTLPRPKGRETHAIVTVYPIPRQPSVVHDLDVDSRGNVWYGNTGWDYIGRLDPKTGVFSEWSAPNYLPPTMPSGLPRLQGVQDIQVDSEDQVWAAIGGTRMARFNPATEKWSTFDVPAVLGGFGGIAPFISPFRGRATTVWTMGTVRNSDGTETLQKAFRLDYKTGKVEGGYSIYEHLPTMHDPVRSIGFFASLRYCYMMDQDLQGNFLCTEAPGSNIMRVNATTGESRAYPTPTPWAYPRRGYTDAQNRFWFGEFYVDQIGVFDATHATFREYPVTPKYISPYFARPDNKGNVWVSSHGSDRLLRLNANTGEILQYLMPVYCDARKVVMDPSTNRTTIWLPNKNTSQLIRVEVLD